MSDLRIVFMGTPDFAVHVLDTIVKKGYKVMGVITAPDKPAGRGRKLSESPIKKYAKEKGLNILQPTNLKNSDFVKALEHLKADIQVVVAFRMLPKIVWNMPKFGTFNLHASLLPNYRGAAPIHWSIINGEQKTGVTTFFLDEKIDTGQIILQDDCEISEKDTAGSLYNKLMILGAILVVKTLIKIENNSVQLTTQPKEISKNAPKLTSQNTRIDWGIHLDNIYNHIRGLNPFPSAWTLISNGDDKIKAQIYSCRKEVENHSFENGTVIVSKKELKIATEGGYLQVLEIKLAGKRKMDISSLLNGYTFSESSKAI